MTEQTLSYQPLVLVDTSNRSRDEWLDWRRKGLGGSDAAAVLGISPFRTARDLYYDKLGIVTADDQENWVAPEMGNLLEPLVARIFEKKTGLKIYQRKCMFQHPKCPWMLADLDYLVELPDGSIAILEIKTTNYNAKDKWWYNGEEIVPVYYEAQGRHYMAVMNIDRVYFCCLYGNNVSGCDARFSFHHMSLDSQLYVFEAPIGLLSFISLYPDDWTSHSYVALCGTGGQAMLQMLKQNPNLLSISLCLDNDEAGMKATQRLTDKLTEKGYNWVGSCVPERKDWNDDLLAQFEQEQEPSMTMEMG